MKKWIIISLISFVLGGGCYELMTYQYDEVLSVEGLVGSDISTVTIATKDWRGHIISTRDELVIKRNDGHYYWYNGEGEQ